MVTPFLLGPPPYRVRPIPSASAPAILSGTIRATEGDTGMPDDPSYDCQRCGACCLAPAGSDGGGYVYLRRDEARYLRRLGMPVIEAALGQPFLAMAEVDGRPACVALA